MSAHVDVVVRAALFGQAPTWDSGTDSILWVDVLSNNVHRTGPSGDHTMEVPQQVSAAKPRSRGGLVLHLAEGIAIFEANERQRTWLVYWAREGAHGWATAVDARGRLWAGTGRPDDLDGWLVRVASDGSPSTVAEGLSDCPGLAWNPDNTRMYLVDAAARRIDVLDFDQDTGEITRRRPWCAVAGGRPAGLCVDIEGCVWVVIDGGAEVRRYTPDGVLDRSLALPAQRPTACCFGGVDLTDLYVTSASEGIEGRPGTSDGALLMLPGVGTGLRTPAFAG